MSFVDTCAAGPFFTKTALTLCRKLLFTNQSRLQGLSNGSDKSNFCFREESKLSNEIVKLMRVRNITPTIFDFGARCQILKDLSDIVHEWVIKVAHSNKLSEGSAEVVPSGSFRQQAYLPSSDLDVVVIGPHYTSKDQFFGQLLEMIICHPRTSNVRSIEGGKVPLIKFRMYEVVVDVAYARVDGLFVPKNEVLKDENFCFSRVTRRESLLPLQSVAANYFIHKSVPHNGEVLTRAIQLLKSWATCRGIYGNLICYLGGIHISVMVACICKAFPFSSLARVVQSFFAIYSSWKWNNPIILEGDVKDLASSMICIQKPGTSEYCSSNVNSTTLKRIVAELQVGAAITKEFTCWSCLLENYRYDLHHERFLKIYISVIDKKMLDQWIDFTKSRFVILIDILKKDANIDCDPNLTEYVESTSPLMKSTSQLYNRIFLWGIIEDKDHNGNYDLGSAVASWRNSLLSRKKQGAIGMVSLDVVPVEFYEMCNDLYRVESKKMQIPIKSFSTGMASLHAPGHR